MIQTEKVLGCCVDMSKSVQENQANLITFVDGDSLTDDSKKYYAYASKQTTVVRLRNVRTIAKMR